MAYRKGKLIPRHHLSYAGANPSKGFSPTTIVIILAIGMFFMLGSAGGTAKSSGW
jgi:hypothetical protein